MTTQPRSHFCNSSSCERTLPPRELPALRAACPANVHIVRQKSAWSNRLACARIVRALRAALDSHFGDTQPVLLMDTVKLHNAQCVLNACRRAGIWVVLVPPKLTWLLQPLDTIGFYSFKVAQAQAYLRARACTPDGQLPIGDFIPCVCTAIRKVLQGRKWAGAFNGDGFGRQQADLSSLVAQHLQLSGPVAIPSVRPAIDQLRLYFPRRARVPTRSLWGPFDEPLAVAAAAAPVPARAVALVG